MFNGVYQHRRVLVTGFSGFKGSWLTGWLNRLGAEVAGVALPMPDPSHFALTAPKIAAGWFDLRNDRKLQELFAAFKPEIVFHLAAQPLVRASYADPVATIDINVTGTARVLESCRRTPSVRAVVVVTSDKCYENRETGVPCVETDPMGGADPYSASKGCAELVTAAFRSSFFSDPDSAKVASVRAGNVVGGGDWAADRLVPDLMRSAAAGKVELLRRPEAVRPWQHVLEPLAGYLWLGTRLLSGDSGAASGWNFGPDETEPPLNVAAAAAELARHWPEIRFAAAEQPEAALPEAGVLRLSSEKARRELGWHAVWSTAEALKYTALWYRDYYRSGVVNTAADFDRYLGRALELELPWTK